MLNILFVIFFFELVFCSFILKRSLDFSVSNKLKYLVEKLSFDFSILKTTPVLLLEFWLFLFVPFSVKTITHCFNSF